MSNPDVKAMEQIMAKMNNAIANADQIKADRAAGKVVVNEKNKEMYDILSKLNNATEKATRKMLTESPVESAVTTKQQDKISMGDYVIEMERKDLAPKIYKTYYNISKNGKNIHTLALFESAMAVLKNYVDNSNSSTDKIIALDEKYDTYLQEAAQHKSRAKTVKESFKRDVYTAKQGQAVSKMKTIKREIKSLI